VWVAAAAVFVLIASLFGFTVLSVEQVEAIRLAGEYNADEYVDELWNTLLIPTIDEQAVELATILNAFEVGEDGTSSKDVLVGVAEEYGLITPGQAHVYMVSGEGEVVSVDDESQFRSIQVSLDGFDGETSVNLYTGPRVPSDDTSVRDAVGFISFGDFDDQMQYGRVAAVINRRLINEVLSSLDVDSLPGRRIRFRGAFTVRTFNLVEIDLNAIYVIPTYVDVQ
jgi:predicted lipoprotein